MLIGKTDVVPMPLQKEGIRDIERFDGNVLLADDMGMGKTIQVLGSFRRNPQWLPALVVCPSAVKYNWQDEARRMGFLADVCEGRKPPKGADDSHGSALTIINFEILDEWREVLKKRGFQTVVVDEIQRIGNIDNAQTEFVQDICKHIGRVMGLSGTPFQIAPIELWPPLNTIWPRRFASRLLFARRYCDPKYVNERWDYTGSSNRDELNEELYKVGMIRRTKDQLDLPPTSEKVIPIRMDDWDQYLHARDHFLEWLREQDPLKVFKARKAENLTKGGYLLRLIAELKISSIARKTAAYLDQNPENKVVLMGIHNDKVLAKLAEALEPYGVITITGTVPTKERHHRVLQFQNDPQTRVTVANMKAAGVGINLTAANFLGFVELWWNPMIMAQAADRIVRIGQTRHTTIAYLVAKGTIEERLCRVIQKRLAIFREVIDDEDLDFFLYDALVKEMLDDAR